MSSFKATQIHQSGRYLWAGAIHCLLCSGVSMNCCHKALNNAEVVVDDLGERSQAVGCAGGVADNVQIGCVLSVVHAHHKHWSISGWGGDDDLLGTTFEVSLDKTKKLINSWLTKAVIQVVPIKVWWPLIEWSNSVRNSHIPMSLSVIFLCWLNIFKKFSHFYRSQYKNW